VGVCVVYTAEFFDKTVKHDANTNNTILLTIDSAIQLSVCYLHDYYLKVILSDQAK